MTTDRARAADRDAAELRFAKDVSKAERRQRIDEVLEDLDLTAHVDKRVKKLSGGQRKRVSTAIELLTRPSLLFLRRAHLRTGPPAGP